MFRPLLFVAIGGASGSVARHLIGESLRGLGETTRWPIATFTVNLVGGLLIGVAAARIAKLPPPAAEDARLLIVTGLLGGFTTFSAFSLEALTLLREGRTLSAVGYVGLSVILALLACAAGMKLAA